MTWLGVDVSKNSYEVCASEQGAKSRSFSGPQALKRLVHWVVQQPQPQVVMEVTGGYERALCKALAARNIWFSAVNPYRARSFMNGLGMRAKTDSIDARLLAQMGERMPLKPSRVPSVALCRLQALVLRRQQVSEQLVMQRNHEEHAQDRTVCASIQRVRRVLSQDLKRLDTAIAQLIASDKELSAKNRRLQTYKGVGPVGAAGLLVHLPELGRLSRGEVAALAGLAPFNFDSGAHRGRRKIRAGRAPVRSLLYMAALVGSQHNPGLKSKYQGLVQRGKEKKVALIAVARKLVITLNAMLKHGQDWQPDHHGLPSPS